jgi:hypothetical protein
MCSVPAQTTLNYVRILAETKHSPKSVWHHLDHVPSLTSSELPHSLYLARYLLADTNEHEEASFGSAETSHLHGPCEAIFNAWCESSKTQGEILADQSIV